MFFNQNTWQEESYAMQDRCQCNPIIEQPIERCIERNICHKVEHICPIHTTVVNNHIYEHTYRPEYSCCEENVVSNVQCGSCSQFQ